MTILRKLSAITAFLLLTSNCIAGQPAARQTDATTFGGTIVQGSPTVFINSQPAARVGDLIITPHILPPTIVCVGGPIVTGSETVRINGQGAARLGDIATTVCGPEAIVTGSPNVLVGN